MMPNHKCLLISIVSHGHYQEITKLLNSIEKYIKKSNVLFVIKENKKESDLYKLNKLFPRLDIKINKFDKVRGYGENHNFNFKNSKNFSHFLIINPDVIFTDFCLDEIFKVKNELFTCKTYLNSGQISDYIRKDSNPFSTVFSYFFRSFRYNIPSNINLDKYWFSGAFLLVNKNLFLSLKGFDETYFMYYEDADLCRRTKLKGFRLNILKQSKIIHEGKRKSIYNLFHFYWHLKSFIKYHLS